MAKRTVCTWCERPVPITKRRDSKFCGVRCRQASHRFAICRGDASPVDRQMRFAYADPPYPGCHGYYPEASPVDHVALIRRLSSEYPDGWALSTSANAVREVWQWCPFARLCVWVRSPRIVKSKRISCSFEVLLVAGGRPRRVAVADRSTSDVLVASPPAGNDAFANDSSPGRSDASFQGPQDALIYRGRHRAFPGALVGMKPPAFSEWMFRQLNAVPGDTLDDIFPGSGAVTEAWKRYTGTGTTPAMKDVAISYA